MFKKILLDEFEDDENFDCSIFKEKEIISNNQEEDYKNLEYIEIIDDIYIDDVEYFDENIITENDNKDDYYDITADGNLVPEIKIEIEKDTNDEKIVKFSLNVIINEETQESIIIDLNITQKTYLLIAEELFKDN